MDDQLHLSEDVLAVAADPIVQLPAARLVVTLGLLLFAVLALDAGAEDLRGRYGLSDGFDLIASLQFRDDGTFAFAWQGCLGPIASASGRYSPEGDIVRLQPVSDNFRKEPIVFSERLRRVRWGPREYLIPDERMIEFVNAVNAGAEPRSRGLGIFYLREGDERKPVTGRPDVPEQWRDYLLSQPVTGKVVRVEQQETRTQRPIVVLSAGAREGLQKGMSLFGFNPNRPSFSADLIVTEVTETSARAIVTFQVRHIKVGDGFSTRRP